ncbi:hypothetical protein D9613_008152 [Agrocybe pediades]|uniref:HNH nuclease domain-containing protein n=1 Tax=Agrocybe pediades TaxID=84607 RepID=A0A8H4QNU0_9AGAR|nr:hypothetical protein D9613_008152 [Agrocybe pediades]
MSFPRALTINMRTPIRASEYDVRQPSLPCSRACARHNNDMAPLPPHLPPENQAVSAYASAYGTCLVVEHALTNLLADTTMNGEEIRLHLVYIRILGYLLHYMPTRAGLDDLTHEIQISTSDNDLVELGQTYYGHILRVYKSNVESGTSDVSDLDAELHAIAKKKALSRDKFCCVISGSYDADALLENVELRNKYSAQVPRPENTFTECAHIFSGAINSDVEPGTAQKRDHAATIRSFGYCFGCSGIHDELKGANIHRLENVMTLDHPLYCFFDRLRLWFVATDQPNQYRVSTSDEIVPYKDKLVTFETDDPVNLPVPSPVYLAIHAACAQAAQLSGAAKYIEKYYEDVGSSADLLDDA